MSERPRFSFLRSSMDPGLPVRHSPEPKRYWHGHRLLILNANLTSEYRRSEFVGRASQFPGAGGMARLDCLALDAVFHVLNVELELAWLSSSTGTRQAKWSRSDSLKPRMLGIP